MKLKVKRHSPPICNDPRYRYLPLARGHNALVPAALYDWLEQWNWHARKVDKTFYAKRWRLKDEAPGSEWVYLHNAIYELLIGPIPNGLTVDHINRDGLDNRLDNFRLATDSDQQHNRAKFANNTSGFIGVYWDRNHNRWRTRTKRNGTTVYRKDFDDAFSAAWNRDQFCRQHCPRATLNNLIDRRIRQLPYAVERRFKPHFYVAA